MADLEFETYLSWYATGNEGNGTVQLGQKEVIYSAPANMGGKGVGTSPEELLLAAVAACYSGTLMGLLTRKGLPVEHVKIRVQGIVTGYPLNAKFATLRVHPDIIGGDKEQRTAYQDVALLARDRCFIGKTIAGNVAYEVLDVQIS